MAKLPDDWKSCKKNDQIFYKNINTNEKIMDHPSDLHYKKLYMEEK